MTDPIRIALIGAGIFARDAHIPAIMELDSTFQIAVIASRTLESAKARAKEIPYPVGITTDIESVLVREDIEAIDIILPIGIQPTILSKVLESGKHVISEKPIAPDVASARGLIDRYSGESVWMVGENFRYEPAVMKSAELIRDGAIGQPVLATFTVHIPILSGSKYFETQWRQEMDFPGGWMMDGGVHHTALLRAILGEVERVGAVGVQHRKAMKQLDTMSASLHFQNGVIGSYNVTFVSGAYHDSLMIAGELGTLRMTRGSVDIVKPNEVYSVPVDEVGSVTAELEAFAKAIREGTPHHNTPEEGLKDVAVIEAMLQSAESGEFVNVST